MARVTTVAQAARVCKMNVESLVNELNGVLGIRSANISASPVAATSDDSTPLPPFTSVVELDVRDELKKGGEPFSRIMAAVAGLGDDAVLHLRAPFEPVPLFGVMEKRGFGHKAEQHADDDWSVWFFRKKEPTEATAPATQPATATAPVAPRIVMTDSAADNRVTERTEVWLDVRDLEPPEPLVRTLEALETLPVDSMLVQVNQRERSDAAARECFCCPRTHAANSDHSNMRAPNACGALLPEQAFQPCEAPLQVWRVVNGCDHFRRARRSFAAAAASDCG